VCATFSDHFAEVFLGHPEFEHMRVLSDDLLDLDFVHLVYQ
jgi:hypothetical protein